MKVEVRLEAKGNRDRQGLLYKSIGKFAWWLLENWQIFKVREGGGIVQIPGIIPQTNVMNKKIIPVRIIIIKRVVKTTRLQDQQPIVGVLL